MPKIFDCFPFFNELDLLELRLNELTNIVDFFVLVEATTTYRGLKKPLNFQQNRDRYAAFLHKIIHVVVNDMPVGGASEPERWDREFFQRQAIVRGLGDARWHDFVIVSDADEIPHPAAIERVAREATIIPTRYAFEMKQYWYFLNLQHPDTLTRAAMTRRAHVIDVNQLRLFGEPWVTPRTQPKRLAKTIKYFGSPMRWRKIADGGWHFTFLNGPEAVREKLFHYSHVVPDEQNTLCNARSMIKDAVQGTTFKIRQIDDQFPGYLCRHIDRFSHNVLSPDPAQNATSALWLSEFGSA